MQVLEQELRLVRVRVRVRELRLVRVQEQEQVQVLELEQALRLVQERCASMRARRCSRARLRA